MTAEKVSKDIAAATLPVQRLCNEIQLFDLCDLDSCAFKVEKYCHNADLLSAFERISDEEARPEVFLAEDLDDGEGAGDEEYDEGFEDDGFEDEAGYEDD